MVDLEFNKAVGKRLREFRIVTLRGMGTEAFADSIGITRQHYYTIEKGRRALTAPMALKIKQLYPAFDFNYIFTGDSRENGGEAYLIREQVAVYSVNTPDTSHEILTKAVLEVTRISKSVELTPDEFAAAIVRLYEMAILSGKSESIDKSAAIRAVASSKKIGNQLPEKITSPRS